MSWDGELPIKFWARAFTRELNLPATVDGFQELARLVGEADESYSPLQIAEMTPGGVVPRVGVTDGTGSWSVQIVGESLDVQWAPSQGGSLAFSDFCRRAGAQIERVLAGKDAKAHRLAVLWERLLPSTSPEELNAASGKLLRLPPMFQKDPFEWDWRAAVRIERSFAETTESTNTLAILKRLQANIQGRPAERLFLQTDVNTDPRKVSARFGAEQAKLFVEACPEWHSEVVAAMIAQLRIDA